MHCIGRLISLFLLFWLIFLIPTTVWSIAFWQVGTRPSTYTETLDSQVYEQLAPLVLPGLVDSIHEDTDSHNLQIALAIIENVDADTWEEVSLEVVSPEWLQAEVGRNATEALDYFHGKHDTFDIVFDLGPVVEGLQGEAGQNLVDQVIENVRDWPMCDVSQTRDLTNYLMGRTGRFVKCEPAPIMVDQMELRLQDGLTEVIDWLPTDGRFVLRDEVINRFDTSPTDYETTVTDTRSFFITLDRTVLAAFLVPLMLLGLIILFAVRSAKDFFLWAGLPLVIGGFLAILPIFPWLYGLTQPLQNASDDSLASFGAQAGSEVARALAGAITMPVLGVTSLMILTGFVFLVLAAIMNEPEKPATQYFYMPSGSTPTGTPAPSASSQPSSPPPINRRELARAASADLPDDHTAITPPDARPGDSQATPPPSDSASQEEILTFVDHSPLMPEDAPSTTDEDEDQEEPNI